MRLQSACWLPSSEGLTGVGASRLSPGPRKEASSRLGGGSPWVTQQLAVPAPGTREGAPLTLQGLLLLLVLCRAVSFSARLSLCAGHDFQNLLAEII